MRIVASDNRYFPTLLDSLQGHKFIFSHKRAEQIVSQNHPNDEHRYLKAGFFF
jgi:hypothetical protein